MYTQRFCHHCWIFGHHETFSGSKRAESPKGKSWNWLPRKFIIFLVMLHFWPPRNLNIIYSIHMLIEWLHYSLTSVIGLHIQKTSVFGFGLLGCWIMFILDVSLIRVVDISRSVLKIIPIDEGKNCKFILKGRSNVVK